MADYVNTEHFVLHTRHDAPRRLAHFIVRRKRGLTVAWIEPVAIMGDRPVASAAQSARSRSASNNPNATPCFRKAAVRYAG